MNRRLHVFPLAISGMVAALLALASVAFDVLAVDGAPKDQKEDPKGKGKNEEEEEEEKPLVRKRRLVLSAQARTALRQMIVFLAFVPVIVTLVMLTLQAINSNGKFDAYLNIQRIPRASLVIVDCMALVADIVLCAAMARL
ncbi:hypothetical protein CPB86DRAFT_820814, partial [Serendipita vermifera]